MRVNRINSIKSPKPSAKSLDIETKKIIREFIGSIAKNNLKEARIELSNIFKRNPPLEIKKAAIAMYKQAEKRVVFTDTIKTAIIDSIRTFKENPQLIAGLAIVSAPVTLPAAGITLSAATITLLFAGGITVAATPGCQAQNPTTPKDSGIIWGRIGGGGGGNNSNKSSRLNSSPKPIVTPSPIISITPAPKKSATPSINPTPGAIYELPQQSPRPIPTATPNSGEEDVRAIHESPLPTTAPTPSSSTPPTSAPIFTPMPTGSPTSQPSAQPTPFTPVVDQGDIESDTTLFVLSKIKSLIFLEKFEEAKTEAKSALSQNYSPNLKKQILAQYLDALSKTDSGLNSAFSIISSWENKSKANPNSPVSIQLGQENFQGIGALKLSPDGYLSGSEDEAVFSIWLNIKFEYYTRNGMSDQAAELALIYLGL